MKAAGIADLKKELSGLSPKALKDICLRLAKYKKENKELLSYLLLEAHDEEGYIQSVREEIDEAFTTINSTNLYWAKKSIRKILRITGKYIRYSGNKQTEVELLIYFCRKLKDSGIPFDKNPVLLQLYRNQLKKIGKALDTLHEDLQYDYTAAISALDMPGL